MVFTHARCSRASAGSANSSSNATAIAFIGPRYNAYIARVVSERSQARAATLAVVVAALGYFVDIYDLILFGMVRGASLKDLGVTDITSEGIFLLNMQMGGM